MQLKEGVSIAKSVPEMDAAHVEIEKCFKHFGCEAVVTSGDEETAIHAGRPLAGDTVNAHYLGKARDYRIWNVPAARRQALVDLIEDTLGPAFVVIWESQGTPNEHLHVQSGHVRMTA
jgi:hypothetical protein